MLRFLKSERFYRLSLTFCFTDDIMDINGNSNLNQEVFIMQEYMLTCCSTADMPQKYMEKRNIPYLCFHYMIDGAEYPDDLGQTMEFDEFYDRVKKGALPTTSQVNSEQFITFFETYLMQGFDILHLSFSSGLSGTYHSACMAKKELEIKYPDRKITIIDSLAASSGYGLLLDLAADLRDAGMSMGDLSLWLETNKLKIHHWFFSTDLSHYKRGGRISSGAAIFGTILNICPLLNMNFEGKLIPRKKVRGKKMVMEAIVQKMIEHAKDGINYNGKCFISHSACREDALRVAQLVEKTFKNLAAPVMIDSIGTVIGSHTGIGTVALFFEGDKRID